MTEGEKVQLFGEYVLDSARGCVLCAGQPVHLRRQSYEVLKYLVENRSRLISKDRLIEEVWQGRAVTDGSLQKCIEEVREALGSDARRYVRNERGRGYIFDPEIVENGRKAAITSEDLDVVRIVIDRDLDSSLTLTQLSEAKAVNNRMRSTLLFLSILVIAGAAIVLIYGNSFSRRPEQINSIAVLPFVNASQNPDADYVSDGLTENLIDELAKLSGLKVIARSSSFTYKGRNVDVQDVGRALGVRAVLTGRFEQRGDALFVRAELVDAQDHSRLWGGQYTRQMIDLQLLDDDIAQAIAARLQVPSIAQEQSKYARVNPQAYEFYLNGLFHFNQRTNEGIRKALDYFNQAVLLDPNFAVGWAWVSRANGNLGGNSLLNPKDTQVKAKAAAERALQLDETLADAHLALARIKQDEWDWAGAEQEYKRAIELSPNLASAHADYGQFLSVMTRHLEALNELKRAQQLDPMSVRLRRQEAWALHLARRTDEALTLMLETVKQGRPTFVGHYGLGFIYEAKGMYSEAIREFREAIEDDGETTGRLCYLAGSLALAGKKKDALAIVDKLNRSTEYVSPTELAAVYARLNDTEAAIKLLEKAYAEHDPQLQILNVDPYFEILRPDPRFQGILRRVGLPSPAVR